MVKCTGSWGDASGRRTAAMQADVDSNPRRRRRPHEGAAAHAAMLELNNSYVWSFDSIDEQLQSGLLPQAVTQSGAACGPSAEQ